MQSANNGKAGESAGRTNSRKPAEENSKKVENAVSSEGKSKSGLWVLFGLIALGLWFVSSIEDSHRDARRELASGAPQVTSSPSRAQRGPHDAH